MLYSLVLVHTVMSSATTPTSRDLGLVGSTEKRVFLYYVWIWCLHLFTRETFFAHCHFPV